MEDTEENKNFERVHCGTSIHKHNPDYRLIPMGPPVEYLQ
jgi:hypothetical protein